jgi:hypothetical protein
MLEWAWEVILTTKMVKSNKTMTTKKSSKSVRS